MPPKPKSAKKGSPSTTSSKKKPASAKKSARKSTKKKEETESEESDVDSLSPKEGDRTTFSPEPRSTTSSPALSASTPDVDDLNLDMLDLEDMDILEKLSDQEIEVEDEEDDQEEDDQEEDDDDEKEFDSPDKKTIYSPNKPDALGVNTLSCSYPQTSTSKSLQQLSDSNSPNSPNTPFYGGVNAMLEHQVFLTKKYGPAVVSPSKSSSSVMDSFVIIERNSNSDFFTEQEILLTPSKLLIHPPNYIPSPGSSRQTSRDEAVSPVFPRKSITRPTHARRPHQSPPTPKFKLATLITNSYTGTATIVEPEDREEEEVYHEGQVIESHTMFLPQQYEDELLQNRKFRTPVRLHSRQDVDGNLVPRMVKLEVSNFKSYRGAHTIGPFKRFTCIVGPNGVGKSNFMDAVSFVLCVEKQKLRVTKLQDLVYQTPEEKSNPGRTAYVKLYFLDDVDDEVVFQRTISANGKSEFLLNDTKLKTEDYIYECEKRNLIAKAQNFLVFQGIVDRLAQTQGQDLTGIFERTCGSFELSREHEYLLDEQEVLEEKQRYIFQKKRQLQSEQKQCSALKKEADEFRKLQSEKEQVVTNGHLHSLYVYEQNLVNAEEDEVVHREQVDQMKENVSKLQEDLKAKNKGRDELTQKLKDADAAAQESRDYFAKIRPQ
eukprot:gene201-99_t